MSVSVTNMSNDELRQLSASIAVHQRQLEAEIGREIQTIAALEAQIEDHRAEVNRLEDRLRVLTDSADDTDTGESEGFDLFMANEGEKVPAGTSYPLLDADGDVIANLAGKGRRWMVIFKGDVVARGSSKQAAIDAFIEAYA